MKKKEKIILENEFAFARFDEFAVSQGHLLFMTKRHIKDFLKLIYKKDKLFLNW